MTASSGLLTLMVRPLPIFLSYSLLGDEAESLGLRSVDSRSRPHRWLTCAASSSGEVVLHSGKVHYDLLAEAERREDLSVALVRVEQYYPLPDAELKRVLERYPDAELVWAQDEPENQGAAPFFQLQALHRPEWVRRFRVISRPASASPAAGSAKRHALEQADLIQRAFAR